MSEIQLIELAGEDFKKFYEEEIWQHCRREADKVRHFTISEKEYCMTTFLEQDFNFYIFLAIGNYLEIAAFYVFSKMERTSMRYFNMDSPYGLLLLDSYWAEMKED